MEASYIGLIGVVVGALITGTVTWLINWSNSKTKLQEMTFEKRLKAHQEAYHWWSKLIEIIPGLDSIPTQELERKKEIFNKALEWWHGNCLYLNRVTRGEMLNFINCYQDCVVFKEIKIGEVWKRAMRCQKSIITGIGLKYLPEEEKLDKVE